VARSHGHAVAPACIHERDGLVCGGGEDACIALWEGGRVTMRVYECVPHACTTRACAGVRVPPCSHSQCV
jgi:hypothetical protein